MINYNEIITPKAEEMRPSGIRRFFDMAAEMKDCITLGVGEPDFKTPWSIRQAGIKSLERGHTFYTSNAGLLDLRKEICAYLNRHYQLEYNPANELLVTIGGSEAIDACIRTLIGPGDEVLIPEPSFVCYNPLTTIAGGTPMAIPLKHENDFRLTAQELKAAITPKTKLLIFPFPCNPTGAVMRKKHLQEIADVLKDTDIIVLSDEIYSELTYGKEPHVSIATLPGMKERTVVVNGFSKSHAMTGWRLGYACGPAPLISIMTKIHQSAIMSAPTTSQYAAIVAIRDCDDEVVHMREQYNIRRRFLMKRLKEIGLDCFEPEGAFYVFPSIACCGLSSDEFCTRLIKESKVAVVPGTAFGASGEGFIRISYAYSLDHLMEALSRIEAFVNQNRKG